MIFLKDCWIDHDYVLSLCYHYLWTFLLWPNLEAAPSGGEEAKPQETTEEKKEETTTETTTAEGETIKEEVKTETTTTTVDAGAAKEPEAEKQEPTQSTTSTSETTTATNAGTVIPAGSNFPSNGDKIVIAPVIVGASIPAAQSEESTKQKEEIEDLNDLIADLEKKVKNLESDLDEALTISKTSNKDRKKMYAEYKESEEDMNKKLHDLEEKLYDAQLSRYTYIEYKQDSRDGFYIGSGQECGELTSCAAWISNSKCVWCTDEVMCVRGNANGPIADHCNNFTGGTISVG